MDRGLGFPRNNRGMERVEQTTFQRSNPLHRGHINRMLNNGEEGEGGVESRAGSRDATT